VQQQTLEAEQKEVEQQAVGAEQKEVQQEAVGSEQKEVQQAAESEEGKESEEVMNERDSENVPKESAKVTRKRLADISAGGSPWKKNTNSRNSAQQENCSLPSATRYHSYTRLFLGSASALSVVVVCCSTYTN
jgi:hypothetical protein